MGGIPATVLFRGQAPGTAGVMQINARIPVNVPTGLEVPLTIEQGSVTTSVLVRVIN